MRVLIVGCGYVGEPLAARLARDGHRVFGLRRTAGRSSELSDLGVEPIVADITEAALLPPLGEGYDWVINCAASGGGDEASYRRLYVTGNANLLRWLRDRPPERFVYTSSTGVYGQNNGAWVTELSETAPAAPTGRVLVEAEQLLLSAHRNAGFPAIICRLAGIYGPGRGYWFKQFISGQARIEGEGARFLNMVHLDDVVGSIVAALERGSAGEVYNVVDSEPVSQLDFFTWLATALGRSLPPPSDAPRPLRRPATNKRVSNEKLRSQLGYEPQFPSFREGYAAAVREVLGESAGQEEENG